MIPNPSKSLDFLEIASCFKEESTIKINAIVNNVRPYTIRKFWVKRQLYHQFAKIYFTYFKLVFLNLKRIFFFYNFFIYLFL